MISARFRVSDGALSMRRFLLAAVMCGVAAAAQAADLPDLPALRGGFTDGLTSRVNWQGFYAGGQVSYGRVTSKADGISNSDLQATFFPPPNVNYLWKPLGMARSNDGGFGAFGGYNAQFEDVVVSFEGNYIHDGFRSTTTGVGLVYLPDNVTVLSSTNSTAVVRLSDFGSARVRGGYAIGCFLPYAFVGYGVGSQTVDRSISAVPGPVRPAWTNDSHSKLVYGYSAGFGLDVMVTGGLFARAEYEYRRVTSNIESNINTVRLGLGYRF
jgi:opacity protein-like surface antigen